METTATNGSATDDLRTLLKRLGELIAGATAARQVVQRYGLAGLSTIDNVSRLAKDVELAATAAASSKPKTWKIAAMSLSDSAKAQHVKRQLRICFGCSNPVGLYFGDQLLGVSQVPFGLQRQFRVGDTLMAKGNPARFHIDKISGLSIFVSLTKEAHE